MALGVDDSRVAELDRALVTSAKKIRVLQALAWPAEAEAEFVRGWLAGRASLPEHRLDRVDTGASVAALDAIAARCDRGHPVERFLADTAGSYADAGRMLSHIGTPEFTRWSTRIYGRPDTVYRLQGISPVDAARFFLEVTDKLLGNPHLPPTEVDIPAEAFAAWLRREVDAFFTRDPVAVELDPAMASKALAGATRIRVRGGAVFSQLDKGQLLHHEAFVHTATQLNGRKQPRLKSLGLGAPRTTRTQEGIAVMAELITNSIDIARLRRVALRVIAVKMALDGADFIDLFKFFLEAGQPEDESVRSAQRVFRGGAVSGGVVFTKDSVYLEGLIEVHTFLRVAIRDNRPGLIRNLFAGRLTMADALRLDPFFQDGWLEGPAYMPEWAGDPRRLAATMAYSAFIANIGLEQLDLGRAIAFEDELKAAQGD
jgi:uncharacterized protein (TIGR02421 family)